jgi:hypothetical protein
MNSPEMDVRIEPGVVPDELACFDTAPDASFFQSPGWLRLVTQVNPALRPWVPSVYNSQGKLLAALPLFEVRRWGMRRLYGGPWGTYGAIVSQDPAATQRLRDWLQETAAQCVLLRLHDFSGTLGNLSQPWQSTEESCQVLELPEDPGELFRGSFTSQNRNKIRKAEKNDVSVELRRDAAAVATYADLYAQSAQRLQVAAPISPALFRGLSDCPGVQVWLAQRQGEPIAGLLNFAWGGQIMNWGNVSVPESWRHAPNNLLHWKAIEYACLDNQGPRLYNFGSSSGLPQVHAFKKAFGAVDRTYWRWERSAVWLRALQRLRRGTS